MDVQKNAATLGLTNRVQQRSILFADCGIACVAMLAGCSYDHARKALGFGKDEDKFYTVHHDLRDGLQHLGCEVKLKRFVSWRKMPGKAIVAVNHTKDGAYWHWVVFDGEAILDPKPNRPGRKTDLRGLLGRGRYLALMPNRE